jgi:hypothetical protein
MKNYKIITEKKYGYFSDSKSLESKKTLLEEMGFRYSGELFNMYEKSFYKNGISLKMCLVPDKEYLYFYSSRYFLPCELDKEYYKDIYNDILLVVRKLKEIGVLKP